MFLQAVRTFFLCALSSFILSDSVTYDRTYIVHQFESHQQYTETAAYYSHPSALFKLSQYTVLSREQSTMLVAKSARAGHVDGIWQQYLLQTEPREKAYWLQKAVVKNHLPAMELAVTEALQTQDWSQVSTLLTNYTVTGDRKPFSRPFLHAKIALDVINNGVKPLASYSTSQYQNQQCVMNVLPVAKSDDELTILNQILKQLDSSTIESLKICFSDTVVVPELFAICSERCNLTQLGSLFFKNTQFSHYLMLTNSEKAFVQAGLMYLPRDAREKVIMHEIAHWFGLIDEYRVSESLQSDICSGQGNIKVGLNLLVRSDATSNQKLGSAPYQRAVDTCNGIEGRQAYSRIPLGYMRYLDIAMTAADAAFIRQNISPDLILSVYPLFAKYSLNETARENWQRAYSNYLNSVKLLQ
jgi:hypothetical protein